MTLRLHSRNVFESLLQGEPVLRGVFMLAAQDAGIKIVPAANGENVKYAKKHYYIPDTEKLDPHRDHPAAALAKRILERNPA
jgi:hypothetical protein